MFLLKPTENILYLFLFDRDGKWLHETRLLTFLAFAGFHGMEYLVVLAVLIFIIFEIILCLFVLSKL